MSQEDRPTRPGPDGSRIDPTGRYQMWSTPDPAIDLASDPVDLTSLRAVPYIHPLAHGDTITTSPAQCAPNKIDTALCSPLASETTASDEAPQPNVPTVPTELAA